MCNDNLIETLWFYYIIHNCLPNQPAYAMKLVNGHKKDSDIITVSSSKLTVQEPSQRIIDHLKHRIGPRFYSRITISQTEYISLCRDLLLQRFMINGDSHIEPARVLAHSIGFRSYVVQHLQGKRNWTFDQLPIIINSVWDNLMKQTKSEIIYEISQLNKIEITEYHEDNTKLDSHYLVDKADRYSLRGDQGKQFLDKLTEAINVNIDNSDDVDQRLESVIVAMRNVIYPNCINCSDR